MSSAPIVSCEIEVSREYTGPSTIDQRSRNAKSLELSEVGCNNFKYKCIYTQLGFYFF